MLFAISRRVLEELYSMEMKILGPIFAKILRVLEELYSMEIFV